MKTSSCASEVSGCTLTNGANNLSNEVVSSHLGLSIKGEGKASVSEPPQGKKGPLDPAIKWPLNSLQNVATAEVVPGI